MLDYLNTYKKFLKSKSHGNMTKAEGHAKGLEIHHVFPKALGGMNSEENKVWLSEFDHCMAHVLLQIAMLQKKEALINYQFRHCFTNGDKNLLTYWNPISKLKIRLTYQNGEFEVMLLSDAVKKITELRCFPNKKVNTILPNGWKPKQRTKNKSMALLFKKLFYGNHKYYGLKWEIAA